MKLHPNRPPKRSGPLVIGDKVRLKSSIQPSGLRIRTRIDQVLPDGRVRLVDALHGFRYWHVDTLERA